MDSCSSAGVVANEQLILFSNYWDDYCEYLVNNRMLDVLAVPGSPERRTPVFLRGFSKMFMM